MINPRPLRPPFTSYPIRLLEAHLEAHKAASAKVFWAASTKARSDADSPCSRFGRKTFRSGLGPQCVGDITWPGASRN